MKTSAPKGIAETLSKLKEQGWYFSVKEKAGSDDVGTFTTSRVKISNHEAAFSKNPDIVYSPSTHLMGEKAVIEQFLKKRRDCSDETSDEVLKSFNSDKDLITKANYKKPGPQAHINEVSLTGERFSKKKSDDKPPRIPLHAVTDIYAIAKKAQKDRKSGAGNQIKLQELIESLTDGKGVSVHGFGAAGDFKKGAKVIDVKEWSKGAKILGETFPLKHFYITPAEANKVYVKNFLKFYYTHIDVDENPSQRANEEADMIILKKGSKRTGRTVSPTGASTKGRKKTTSPASKRSKSASVASSRSATPPTVVSKGTTRKGRTAVPKSDVESELESERASSVSSSSPSTVSSRGSTRSPKAARMSSSPDRSRSSSPAKVSTSPKRASSTSQPRQGLKRRPRIVS